MKQNNPEAKQLIGQRLMLAFEGIKAPAQIIEWIKERNPAGFTLFRAKNVESPAQILALNNSLQEAAAAAGSGPLLIAADQEGGQFNALGEHTTDFPGNMALGATRDPKLAQRVGKAIGLEVAAMGLNINYAPDSDINRNPDNPNVGIRAFGDDPQLIAEMSAAMVTGLQSAGVAATAKHFPGNGSSSLDPHFGVPVLNHDAEWLNEVEFLPFQAAMDAGVRLMMTAHIGLPALTGRPDLPATLSHEIMTGLLRDQMGFRGLLISDALDMKAITQGAGQIVDVIAAIRAGVDLLLLTGDPEVRERIYSGLLLAYDRGLLRDEHLAASNQRLLSLQQWLGFFNQNRPDLGVVGCGDHLTLAKTVARRSLTLVRNRKRLIPLDLSGDDRIAVIVPHPADLTPADTSSYVKPTLAEFIRTYHPNVDEIITAQRPLPAEIGALTERAANYDLLIIGTISAHLQPEQAALANELLATGVPAVTVAMRTPYDLTVYPQADTYICTYSILPVSMRELAAALWGGVPFQGKLPVRLKALGNKK